ncbi:hypothetical protein F5Y19DRAFT_429963 [Xylariaceae sp. FL1651]|nr:hypothetical protein F5Y19DRAFT_429963 [Xylariaceae sp. FL1651]
MKRCRLIKINPASLDTPQRTSFVETIRHLREIFLHEQVAGRINLGFLTAPLTCYDRLNRALPANATSMGFACLGPDPRPIRADLGNIFICEESCDIVRLWNDYIDQHFGRIGMPQTMSSILVTRLWHHDDVHSR